MRQAPHGCCHKKKTSHKETLSHAQRCGYKAHRLRPPFNRKVIKMMGTTADIDAEDNEHSSQTEGVIPSLKRKEPLDCAGEPAPKKVASAADEDVDPAEHELSDDEFVGVIMRPPNIYPTPYVHSGKVHTLTQGKVWNAVEVLAGPIVNQYVLENDALKAKLYEVENRMVKLERDK